MSTSDVIVSLDIGTSEIKVVIGEMLDHTLNIMGVGTADSKGINKGAIVDIDQTVQSIKAAVDQAEKMVGLDIKSVVVGVSGSQVQLQACHGVVAVQSENSEITDEDIQRVIENAQVVSIPPEREVVDVIPTQFIVDGLDGITDPRGMIGVRLEMQGTIITTSRTALHNALKCVERAGLKVSDIALESLGAGMVALSLDERDMGAAIIDVGAGTTTVSVYAEGDLVAVSEIPLGGDNITKDLSIGLRTSTVDAEQIKREYGHAYYPTASETDEFKVKIIGSEHQEVYNQLQIADMIEARLEEIFQLALQEVSRFGYTDLRGGYVLTGGTMNLPGAIELAQEIFSGNARLAKPDYLGVREPEFTAGVGLIQFVDENARVQGKQLGSALGISGETLNASDELDSRPRTKAKKQAESNPSGEKKESKFANFFKMFLE